MTKEAHGLEFVKVSKNKRKNTYAFLIFFSLSLSLPKSRNTCQFGCVFFLEVKYFSKPKHRCDNSITESSLSSAVQWKYYEKKKKKKKEEELKRWGGLGWVTDSFDTPEHLDNY